MTKMEFLEGLRKALGNDLDRATVQENVNYYDGYISDEVSKGKTEEEVTAELGDPWVIAQTVIDAEEAKRGMSRMMAAPIHLRAAYISDPVYGDGGDYTKEDYASQNQEYQTHVHAFGFDTWWKKLLLVLGIIGIIVLVVSIVGGIISLLAPILIPLVIIMLIIRLIGGSGRRW